MVIALFPRPHLNGQGKLKRKDTFRKAHHPWYHLFRNFLHTYEKINSYTAISGVRTSDLHIDSDWFKKCISKKSSKSVESLHRPNGIFLKLYDVIYHIGPHSGDAPKIDNFSTHPHLLHFTKKWENEKVGKWKNCQFLAHLPSGVQYDR